ncbi:MAG: hypothetical protein ACJ8H8_25375 [Geminicoccaceae bacterium]|jgi:hypothetical protein
MVTDLSVYRSATGEQFFRTSPTGGRTTSYRVESESVAALERWLRENGFRPVVQVQAQAA